MSADAPPAAPVRRRHVFYLSGFDPQGPARYHAMYADEARRQAVVNGMQIEVGPRHNAGKERSWWDVLAHDGGQTVRTRYEFLRWDDIVRAHWPRSRWAQAAQAFSTPWRYLRSGALFRLAALYPPSVYVLLAPAALLVGVGAAFVLLALTAAWAAGRWGVAAGLLWPVGVAAAFVLARHAERRMQLAWLTRSYAFTTRHADGEAPAIEERLDVFGRRIAEVVTTGDVDEVLVVGHSSGAQMAVSAVARALDADPAAVPSLALMTLGHCMPIVTLLPSAARFRKDLRRTANATGWHWIDFTAPADGCTFVLVDPTTGCDGVPGAPADRPKLLSPRFASMFSPERYAPLRRDKLRYHFQYLMATERPGVYDYFLVTAGAQSLRQRFGGLRSLVDFHGRRRGDRR